MLTMAAKQKTCEYYGKSIAKDKLEGAFEALLQNLRPSLPILKLATAIFEKIWDQEVINFEARRKALESDLRRIDRDIDRMVARIMETSQPALVSAYEGKITELQTSKAVLEDKLAHVGGDNLVDSAGFNETYRTALEFLANPCNLWRSERIQDKRAVLKLTFTTPSHTTERKVIEPWI